MNGLEYNHQVFILNGQPVIIQRDQDASTTGIVSDDNGIALRQDSLQESHSNISESGETPQFDINRDGIIQETNSEEVGVVSGNQFVAYVGDSDEDDVPTIHITLEQAAELGLQFDNDEMKLDSSDLPMVSQNETIEQNKQLLPFSVFASKNSAVSNDELELAVFSDRKIINDTVCHSLSERISKDSVTQADSNFKMAVDESVVGGLNLDGTDQQITLIPHFANGTITYSVQVNNSVSSFPEKQSKNDKKIVNTNVQSKPGMQLADFDAAPVNCSTYNNNLKTFTTCTDLASFVESNLDNSNQQPSISNAEIINVASQNVIDNATEGNINFTSHTVTDCAENKTQTVNFTPLSDLLKCNVLNSSKSSNQSLTNYQPISLTQLINTINKNQNRPQTSGKVFSNHALISTQTLLKTNGRTVNSSNSGTDDSNCKLTDVSGVSFNMKNNSDKVALLKNRPTLCSNSVVLNNANVLVPIETSTTNKTQTLLQTFSKLSSEASNQNTASNGLVSNLTDTSKSITTSVPVIGNHVVMSSGIGSSVIGQNGGSNTSMINNTVIGISSISTNSEEFKSTNVNTIANNGLSLIQSVISNKNGINTSATTTDRLLTENGVKINGNDCSIDFHNQLPRSTEVPVTTSNLPLTHTTLSTSSQVIASTSASSAVCSTSPTVTVAAGLTTATRAVNTLSLVTPVPTVKSVKPSDNKCILPKEVSAALNRLPLFSNANKPLGSSENPIQLVQQGQTFHSAQALTADQLKQVTTVLQQNNLGTSIPAKNILYDAETNTKIIYRVVYPEEFDLKEASISTEEMNGKTRKRGRPSLKSSHAKDSSSANVHDENTVVKRKQPLPRTRSGRLSRPPRYMVRDYKRIKRSELDDSDGAYSDYQSDHEEDNATGEKNLLPGLLLPQKRNISSTFRCPTCNKIYLGYRRMAHHFDKYSDHGTEEYLLRLKKACENKQMPYSPSSSMNLNVGQANTVQSGSVFKTGESQISASNPTTALETISVNTTVMPTKALAGSGSVDGAVAGCTETVTVTSSLPTNLPVSDDTVSMNVQNGIASFSINKCATVIGGVKVGTGFARKRGRRKNGKEIVEGASNAGLVSQNLPQYSPQLHSQLPPEQIKTRLRELLELCDVTELVQVAGPAVCSVLTTWELLLLRVDSMCSQQNRITALCDEIKSLLSRFKELASTLFQPVDNVIKNNCSNLIFEMEDKAVSSAFGLPCGVYKINESLLKTEHIINACRSKPLPADWENEQRVLNDRSAINNDEQTSPVLDINSIVDDTQNGLNVFDNSSKIVKEQPHKDDGNSEDRSDCGMTGTNGTINGDVINNENNADNNRTADMSSGQYILTNDSEMLCEERDGLDDSVEQIVNEQLKNLTSQNQDLTKVEVDELMKDFSVLEQRHGPHGRGVPDDDHHHHGMVHQIRSDQSVDLDPSDDLMDGFTSITDQRNHVSASTEDLIKSLENFSSELHNSTCDETSRQDFMNGGDNFNGRVVNNVNVVDTLDFDVLSRDFHSNGVNQR